MYIIIKVDTELNIPDLEGMFESLESALKYMNDKIVNNENQNSYMKNESQSDIINYYEKEDNYLWPNKSVLKYKYRIIKLSNNNNNKLNNKNDVVIINNNNKPIHNKKNNQKKSYKDVLISKNM